jgi:hypothetical protein
LHGKLKVLSSGNKGIFLNFVAIKFDDEWKKKVLLLKFFAQEMERDFSQFCRDQVWWRIKRRKSDQKPFDHVVL